MISVSDLPAFYDRTDELVLQDANFGLAHSTLLQGLEAGALRVAWPREGDWEVQTWIKRAILLGFRASSLEEMPGWGMPAVDKWAYPPRHFGLADGVRLVPGGSAVRRGAYVARGVVIMPPAYVNVGAYVDEGTMVDSHALVGSCAQVGKRVHLSAGAQLGGVLEPAGATPVIVEDDAFIGALAGVFEGVRVKRRAVLAPGVILTANTRVFDLVNGCSWQGEVPEGAVVVSGSRPASGAFAQSLGLQLGAAVIVKIRDEKTDSATALEEALR